MSWKQVDLGNHVSIKSGKRMPKGVDFASGESEHPYIRARDIVSGKVEIVEPVYVPESVFPRIRQYVVDAGNVCVTIVGANVGAVGQVPDSLHGANLTENAVRFTQLNGLNQDFLKFALLTDRCQQQMKYVAGGAAQPKLGIYKIKRIKIPLPPIQKQETIASILAKYDDLIENNRRRIGLLEEAAQQLYKEWFVRLRVPGHENTKIIDGVPEGWEKKEMIDVCELVMGQSPKSEFYNDTGEGLPFHQGVTHFGERFVTHEKYCTVFNRIAEPGDILCSVRAPVGRFNLTTDRIVIGRGLSAIRNRSGFQSFQYYQLKSHFHKEDMIGSGAIFASVTKKQMQTQLLLTPERQVIEDFEKITKPIGQQIENLHRQNERLTEARDLLLPRLMSGEIEV